MSLPQWKCLYHEFEQMERKMVCFRGNYRETTEREKKRPLLFVKELSEGLRQKTKHEGKGWGWGVIWECLYTSSPSPSHGFHPESCHNFVSGDSAFQGLLVSLAALISAMNSQLFVFVQLNPGLFMTVYHGGSLCMGRPHYWVSKINDIHHQSWVKQ